MENLASGVIAKALATTHQMTDPQAGELADKAHMAARLAKADLASGMVAEFPELQGLMGRYYALADGEPADVAEAIAEHYSPQGPKDTCPTAPVSVAVALADKLDTLVGFFAIDQKPTGSKDPFALRRAALGIIRLILQNNLRLNLQDAIFSSLELYANELPEKVDSNRVALELMAFIADRLKVYLKDDGIRHDHIDAVFGVASDDDLIRLVARMRALGTFLASDDGANLVTAYKRASNIVRAEEKKDQVSFEGTINAKLLQDAEETNLFEALSEQSKLINDHVAEENFAAAMAAVASLRWPVDAFFDKVTVNADDADLRQNRLRLLSQIRSALSAVADFSKLEG